MMTTVKVLKREVIDGVEHTRRFILAPDVDTTPSEQIEALLDVYEACEKDSDVSVVEVCENLRKLIDNVRQCE